MNIDNIKETVSRAGAELLKDSPIVGVGGASLFGASLDTWVLILAILYGAARIAWLGVEAYWKWKDRQDGKSK